MALPFLEVDVVSSARGVIKPNRERINISLIHSGQVIYSKLVNNKKVAKGDTLLIIDDQGIDEKLNLIGYQIRETLSFIADLSILVSNKTVRISELSSAKYEKGYLHYHQKLRELQLRFKKIKSDFERYKILYEKGVVARLEYENYKLELDLAESGIIQHRDQQKNFWQTDLVAYNKTLKELQTTKGQLEESKNQYIITAPVGGTLLNINNQETGSFVNAGSVLAEISPGSNLVVECYVSPSDIGLIKEQDHASFQIEAYNYNQWGLATGQVIEIGRDLEYSGEQSVFKVRCSLDQNYLTLKNGFRGNLRKGMTLNANFILSRRTLFELFYDNMDDWLNPSGSSPAPQ
jgi:HlyD family secretion protein